MATIHIFHRVRLLSFGETMTKPTMSKKLAKEVTKGHISPFEQIRRTNDAGNEYWSSRDFAHVLGYSDYRNFEQVIN